MQSEVGFEWRGHDVRSWMESGEISEGLLQIALAALVLIAISPTLLRPLLRPLVGDATASRLAIPEDRERIFLAVTGASALAASLYMLSALVPTIWRNGSFGTAGVIRDFAELGNVFQIALIVSSLLAGSTLLLSLVQHIADVRLGGGYGALGLIGAFLSGAIVLATGQPLLWMLVWFPICALAGMFCRRLAHPAWRVLLWVACPLIGLLGVVAAVVTFRDHIG